MARPSKTQKVNNVVGGGGGNSTTIDDLDDNMLTQILFKLSSCAPIIACKLVNKRWCSLISDPKFASLFSDHKKESTTLSEGGSNIEDDEPPWTFILNMFRDQRCVGNASTNESVFGSPKFSLEYLPCTPNNFRIKATFMDLVLCFSYPIFYITNPVTKQWVSLPQIPFIKYDLRMEPWVGLICQQPYDYTRDYKFRVVVIHQSPPPVYKLQVYCSEIGEWKIFDLRVFKNYAQKCHNFFRFQAVVCNNIIYLHHELYFAAFNPFDLEEITNTGTIEAKVLPSLPYPIDGYLRESSGQLFIMHSLEKRHSVWYNKRRRDIELQLMVWKLDPNQVPLIWKTAFEGSCSGNVIEPPYDNYSAYDIHIWNIGMHPNNDKLIYVHLWGEHQFVCCDTRTKLIKPLKNLRPIYNLETFNRLELQWWPTSVPNVYV